MALTYEPIATHTATGSLSDVAFSSIPSTYTDLLMVVTGRGLVSANSVLIQAYLNNDTNTNYSHNYFRGDGSSVETGRGNNNAGAFLGYLPAASVANSIGTVIFNVMNYSNNTTNKTILSRTNGTTTSTYAGAYVSLWRSTSVVSIVNVATYGVGNFESGTTFTLYGIKAA